MGNWLGRMPIGLSKTVPETELSERCSATGTPRPKSSLPPANRRTSTSRASIANCARSWWRSSAPARRRDLHWPRCPGIDPRRLFSPRQEVPALIGRTRSGTSASKDTALPRKKLKKRWPRPRSWHCLECNVREVRQLVVVGQKHVIAELDRSGEMVCVGEPVTPRLSGRNRWVCVAAPDRACPCLRRGSQAQRPQVRPAEEPERVRQSLAAARAKDGDQTFRESQLVDRKSMAGLFDAVR